MTSTIKQRLNKLEVALEGDGVNIIFARQVDPGEKVTGWRFVSPIELLVLRRPGEDDEALKERAIEEALAMGRVENKANGGLPLVFMTKAETA